MRAVVAILSYPLKIQLAPWIFTILVKAPSYSMGFLFLSSFFLRGYFLQDQLPWLIHPVAP